MLYDKKCSLHIFQQLKIYWLFDMKKDDARNGNKRLDSPSASI